ncbi:MAG TPA: hypothetical protein VFP34_17240, partial [Microlunatus sp.]|nr:hypothetical protein [Microlunatus sp.]
EKNERILRSMLTTLHGCSLDRVEQAQTLGTVVLPRALIHSGYLTAIAGAGPDSGPRALRRLSKLLADPLVTELEPDDLLEVTPAQLAAVAESDWAAVVALMRPDATARPAGARARWVGRGRRVVDIVSGRERHRHVVGDLAKLQQSMKSLRDEQRRLEALLRAEFALRDLIAAQQRPAIPNGMPGEPRALASTVIQEVVRHVLTHQPSTVVQCGTGAATMSVGRALDHAGEGRLISLETSSEWVGTFSGLLEHEGMRSVEIRHAPIEPVGVGGRTATWYASTALADVETIDLLLVDGVRDRSNHPTRYPALPVLRDRLRHGATVMLDDCQWDEKETLSRWLKDVPGLTLVRQVASLAVMEVT